MCSQTNLEPFILRKTHTRTPRGRVPGWHPAHAKLICTTTARVTLVVEESDLVRDLERYLITDGP